MESALSRWTAIFPIKSQATDYFLTLLAVFLTSFFRSLKVSAVSFLIPLISLAIFFRARFTLEAMPGITQHKQGIMVFIPELEQQMFETYGKMPARGLTVGE